MLALASSGDAIYGNKHLPNGYRFVSYDLATGSITDLGESAESAAVSGNRVVWLHASVENSEVTGCEGAPCCGASVSHWQLHVLSPGAASSLVVATGDSQRPGWGMCEDSMAPLLAFDGNRVAMAEWDLIAILDVGTGRLLREVQAEWSVTWIGLAGDYLAFRETETGDDDGRLMMAALPNGAPKLRIDHVAWAAIAEGRIAWLPYEPTDGTAWTAALDGGKPVALPNPYPALGHLDEPVGLVLAEWDSLVAASADYVAWSWLTPDGDLALWRSGQSRPCRLATPGSDHRGVGYLVRVDAQWLVWMPGPPFRPSEWLDQDDPLTYALPGEDWPCAAE